MTTSYSIAYLGSSYNYLALLEKKNLIEVFWVCLASLIKDLIIFRMIIKLFEVRFGL